MTYDAYPASSAQKRLYLINKLQGDSLLYNIRQAWTIRGPFDSSQLEKALQLLIPRQEGLRTSFLDKDGKILQLVHHEIDVPFQFNNIQETEIQQAINDFYRPFNLGTPPLWRVRLNQLEEEKYLLMFDIHHIIADGTSTAILMDELMTFYRGGSLPGLEFQYVDYTFWQNDMLESELCKLQESYWLNVFEGEIPVLELPTDFTRPNQPFIDGSSIDFDASPQLSTALNNLASSHETTLFTVLTALLNLLLSKETGQNHITLGIPITGRSHPEFDRIIGMFVNTLALLNPVNHWENIHRLIHDTGSRIFHAFDNQDYPFEILVEKLVPNRSFNRNPLFDVMFAMQNFAVARKVDIPGNTIQLSPFSISEKVSKFDLTFFAYQIDAVLTFQKALKYALRLPLILWEQTPRILMIVACGQ